MVSSESRWTTISSREFVLGSVYSALTLSPIFSDVRKSFLPFEATSISLFFEALGVEVGVGVADGEADGVSEIVGVGVVVGVGVGVVVGVGVGVVVGLIVEVAEGVGVEVLVGVGVGVGFLV